jgi:class 3 adenylate cyclase
MAQEVTFAFTDIEGSTTRQERDWVAMHDAVRRHDAIVRTAITERSGHVFKTGGDAFYSAFASPQDAVSAMLAAQQALNAQDFSAVDGLHVRAEIHTGLAEIREGDYFGPALNKVARLLAIGHGGQVLVTAETATLLGLMCASQGRHAEAEGHHLRALAIREKAFGPDRPDVAQSLNNLGGLYCLQGRHDKAEQLLARALEIREKTLAPDHVEIAETLNAMAEVYRGQSRYAEAQPLLERALAIREKSLGSDHPLTVKARASLAALRGEISPE